MSTAGAVAEVGPPPPKSVIALVASFLSPVKDDSAICRTCTIQDKISLGNCEMTKFSGICEGSR